MNNKDTDALVTRLRELEDPEKEAFPSVANTDWRTLAGVVASEIEALRQQLANSQKREVMLRDALSLAYTNEGGYHEWKETASSALAATADLENVRLCEKEPVCWIHRRGNYADASLCPLCDGDISRGWEQDQLYRAWEPKP